MTTIRTDALVPHADRAQCLTCAWSRPAADALGAGTAAISHVGAFPDHQVLVTSSSVRLVYSEPDAPVTL